MMYKDQWMMNDFVNKDKITLILLVVFDTTILVRLRSKGFCQ